MPSFHLTAPDPTIPTRVARIEHASVLIVEDDAFDRTRLKRLCAGFDFTVTVTCADTLAGMESAMEKGRFDLILLDYTLPDGEGERGLAMISAAPRHRDVATIIITSREEPEVMNRAMEGGAFDFLRKRDLSASSIRRAALNALQKAGLMRRSAQLAADHARLAAAMRHFGTELADDLTPHLAGLHHRLDRLDRDDIGPQAARAERDALRREVTLLADRIAALRHPAGTARGLTRMHQALRDRPGAARGGNKTDLPRLFAHRAGGPAGRSSDAHGAAHHA